jgi:hypothetical protein
MGSESTTHGRADKSYQVLVRKPEEKKPLVRPRHRWEDSIKMDLKEIGCEDVDWIHVAQVSVQWWVLVNLAMKLWIS